MTKSIRATFVAAATLALAAAATAGCGTGSPPTDTASTAPEPATETTPSEALLGMQAETVASVTSTISSTPCGVTVNATFYPQFVYPQPAPEVVSILSPSQFSVPSTIQLTGQGATGWSFTSAVYFTFSGPLPPVTCTYSSTTTGALTLTFVPGSCTGDPAVTSGSVQTAQTFSIAFDPNGTNAPTSASLNLSLNGSSVCNDACSPGKNTCQNSAQAVCSTATTCASTTRAPQGLKVVMGTGGAGGRIVDGSGNTLQLHGANITGPESACYGGVIPGANAGVDGETSPEGVFDGPATLQDSIRSMQAWRINAVRIPLNEDCWFGTKTVQAMTAYKGTRYQDAVHAAVQQFELAGMDVVLDLHHSAPLTAAATTQVAMADLDSSPAFWTSVATAYKSDSSVIFDLFNEPEILPPGLIKSNVVSTPISSDYWDCWRAGGVNHQCAADTGIGFKVAGMSDLLRAVRATAATNVVIMGGLYYSTYFDRWSEEVGYMTSTDGLPSSYLNNVAASWHQYDDKHDTTCPNEANGLQSRCNSPVDTANQAFVPNGVLKAGYPVIVGETGIHPYNQDEGDGGSLNPFLPQADAVVDYPSQIAEIKTWFDGFLAYAESKNIGYLAWSWSTSRSPYLLALDANGTYAPSFEFGLAYQAHLRQTFCCAP